MMNPEQSRTAAMLSPDRPPHARRKQPNQGLLRLLRVLMLALGSAVLLVGLLLLLLPMLRVSAVEVSGNSHQKTEEILAAAGVKEGDELLALDLQGVVDRIVESCPYVEQVSVRVSFFTVEIEVEERSRVMYTEYGGEFLSFDGGFRVLEIGKGEGELSPFLRVKLPPIAGATAGSRLSFVGGTDVSYVAKLLSALEEAELYPSVTYADLSERFSLSFVLEGKCRVELGGVSGAGEKLVLLDRILEEKGGATAAYAVVDLTDPEKPTYRTVDASEI